MYGYYSHDFQPTMLLLSAPTVTIDYAMIYPLVSRGNHSVSLCKASCTLHFMDMEHQIFH